MSLQNNIGVAHLIIINIMPTSYHFFKPEIRDIIIRSFLPEASILDVGAGEGTYARLLWPEFRNIDAVEIWEPYIIQYQLEKMYRNIFKVNIMDFEFEYYDLIIIGDVLEHLSLEDATKLIDYIYPRCHNFIIAVPYMLPQGEYEGNVYETHLQPDLTPQNVLERYPKMKLLYGNHLYGYYVKDITV
jgi:2-polyprenyl-3-methyl-5-hydroxy-6-metoxy-1,4-benzoquinol methylase